MPRRRTAARRRRPPAARLLAGVAGAVTLGTAAAFLIGTEILLRAWTHRITGAYLVPLRRGKRLLLPPSPESLAPGVIGAAALAPARAHALLGPALPRPRGAPYVERPILQERGGRLETGQMVWVSPLAYNGSPAQAGTDYETVSVRTPLGLLPAWHVPPAAPAGQPTPERDLIVIQIHGHGGQRTHGLRSLPAAARTGAGQLFITFRNAFGAPRTAKRHLSLGDVEAEDVIAALEWARQQGYQQAVLYGYSMGGNIALSALRRHFEPHPLPIRGAVLDSPALEWRSILRHILARGGVPDILTPAVAGLVEWLAVRRGGVDFDAVDQLAAAPLFRVPILLFQSPADKTIPLGPARALAAARPDLVDLQVVPGAPHIMTWNMNPERYEAALEAFIRRVWH